ncbi:HD domain-containing protein [[Clostridium] dakarense]|uniref:HD domain-containing protein n=1 Tax=Faecalimicrobium dakarense TaxID=1301100 RepID=UPI0004B014A7|nr:HD domain-containing protein [[Clostridium] dakarense]
MIIKDNLYGEFEVEPLIEELINSRAVQRLKYVHQGGASYLVNESWNVTRYEHSVGVMLLIKKLGGSIEEQIAGLLHDISHTAFSHVVDYALDYEEEDYHEKIYNKVINDSDIPQILNQYGYDYKDILGNDEKYTLLEKKAPHLCADRIDYTLRDMYAYKSINKSDIEKFLDSLIVVDNMIAIDDIKIAKWFVNLYCKEVTEYFMHPLSVYGNNLLVNIIKISLKNNILSLDDLLKNDNEVMDILKNSENKEVKDLLYKFKSNVILKEDKVSYDIHQNFKVRLIDPEVEINNSIYKISDVCEEIKEINKNAYNKIKEGVYLKIINTH